MVLIRHDLKCINLYHKIFFPSKNNSKNLDPSHKMDLDFLGCFLGRDSFKERSQYSVFRQK